MQLEGSCRPSTRVRQLLIEHGVLLAACFAHRFELGVGLFEIGIYFGFVGKIERQSAINLFERQDRE